MSRIEQLISEIEEYIDSCKFQALSNTKILVNKEELEELLVELRLRIPDEIKKYQKIISNQDVIISEAQAQAQSILSEAQTNADETLTNARTEAETLTTQARAQTTELVNEHEIMQQAYTHANEVVEEANARAQAILDQASTQAQSIVDHAVADANNIRQGSIQYTDDILSSLQSIISHSMEGAQGRFDAFMASMQSSYDIVSSNRNELTMPAQEDENTL